MRVPLTPGRCGLARRGTSDRVVARCGQICRACGELSRRVAGRASDGGGIAILCDSAHHEYATEQAIALRELGVKVTLVCVDRRNDTGTFGSDRDAVLARATDHGVTAAVMRRRSTRRLIADTRWLLRVLKRARVAVLIAHQSYDPRFALAGLRYPTVVFLHDPSPHSDDPLSVLPMAARTVARFAEVTATAVAIHSTSLDGQVKALVARHPRIHVPHGASVSYSPASIPRAPHLLVYGRLSGYKGVDIAIAAYARVRAVLPEVTLTVAGRGPEGDALARLKLPGFELDDRYVPRREVDELLESATLVLLPYRDATQSGIGTQALGRGIPCVVSNVGALPDLVRAVAPGLVIPPGDADALASAILAYLDHGIDLRRDLQAYARAAYAWPVAANCLVVACTQMGIRVRNAAGV